MIFKKSPMDLNINGESFFIKTDFRDWIQFEKTINQYAETEEEKMQEKEIGDSNTPKAGLSTNLN